METECHGIHFFSNFDSGNLARVEPAYQTSRRISVNDGIDTVEFNLWTRPDCYGTKFENGNRTWFFFGFKFVSLKQQIRTLKFNMMNLNKQNKLFSQGMLPIFMTHSLNSSSNSNWQRIRDRPTYRTEDINFILSFCLRLGDFEPNSTTFVAFTYPYSYQQLQCHLNILEDKYGCGIKPAAHFISQSDSIYFHRECVTHSLEGRRLDVLTVSSGHDMLNEHESKLKGLLNTSRRPYRFANRKKVVFLSARVHPGETQSSFVVNGFLSFILRDGHVDHRARALRRKFVFKIIPMLNPDGVVNGHYRTDTRGVNLNRVYAKPSKKAHPTIFAARKLLLYAHYGYDIIENDNCSITTLNIPDSINVPSQSWKSSVSASSPGDASRRSQRWLRSSPVAPSSVKDSDWISELTDTSRCSEGDESVADFSAPSCNAIPPPTSFIGALKGSSGLYLYIDIHGHASKRGIFMFGNYFDDNDMKIDTMIFPKLMSINCANFDFAACSFSQRNMYLKDRQTGAGREGCGRVSVYKITGLVYSYTMECNFNTGREVNRVPSASRDGGRATPPINLTNPPKYTPLIYEEVGRSMAVSILDLLDINPWSRLAHSSCKSIQGVREYLRRYLKSMESVETSCMETRSKISLIPSTSLPIPPLSSKNAVKTKNSENIRARSKSSHRSLHSSSSTSKSISTNKSSIKQRKKVVKRNRSIGLGSLSRSSLEHVPGTSTNYDMDLNAGNITSLPRKGKKQNYHKLKKQKVRPKKYSSILNLPSNKSNKF